MKWNLLFIILFSLSGLSCTPNDCKNNFNTFSIFSEKCPNITFGILSYAKITHLDENILFCLNGKSYTTNFIEEKLGIQIEDKAALSHIENFIEELYITEYIKTTSSSFENNSLWEKKKFILNRVSKQIAISEEEAREYLNRNWIWFDNEPFENIQSQITNFALDDKKQIYYEEYIQNIGKSTPIFLSESWIEKIAPLQFNHPVYDILQNGKKSIVIFSYGCCKPDVMLPEIEILKQNYEEEINIVHIDSKNEYQVTQRFMVKTNPTIFIFDSKAHLKHKILYYHSANELMKIVTSL